MRNLMAGNEGSQGGTEDREAPVPTFRSMRGLSILPLVVLAACGTLRIPFPGAEAPILADEFDGLWILTETGTPETSPSPLWWLSSGAWLAAREGTARTVQGTVCETDPWRYRYAQANPRDTDGGARPQNVFRLVSLDRWKNFTQEMRFRIHAVNPAPDGGLPDWSGVYFFQRRKDSANTYYAGLRIDGAAVIKKKLDGQYSTLAYQRVYDPDAPRSDDDVPHLPVGRWLEMRSTVEDRADGSVLIRLFLRDPTSPAETDWVEVARATDEGENGPPLHVTAPTGIRTDFLDVEFDHYVTRPLP